MLFCLSTIITASASPIDKNNIDYIEKNIQNYIIELYKNKDLGTEFKSNINLSNDINIYNNEKISTHQYVTKLYETYKENYNINVVPLNSIVTDNNILFSYQVITEYNYVNADFKTTNSEEIFVCYNLTDNQIIDCYTPSNYYDISIRGEISQTSIKNNKFTTSNEIKARKNNLITDINNTFEHETTNTDSKKAPAKAVKSINNTAVVNYARANYNKASPARGKSTVPYYDFSTISGSYDCTNFVSHALLAGGANTNDPGGNGISGSGWYFRSINNRSSSWSGVTNLYNYLVNNTKANTAAGKGNTYTLNGAFWGIGDVLQFKASGSSVYSHSTIITQKKYSDDRARCYAYVTGRTSKSSYNNNTAAADMFPGGAKRTIWVYNN